MRYKYMKTETAWGEKNFNYFVVTPPLAWSIKSAALFVSWVQLLSTSFRTSWTALAFFTEFLGFVWDDDVIWIDRLVSSADIINGWNQICEITRLGVKLQ